MPSNLSSWDVAFWLVGPVWNRTPVGVCGVAQGGAVEAKAPQPSSSGFGGFDVWLKLFWSRSFRPNR